uniref:Uncharacterized protein n=1 Tax=Tetraselmis chuii TaxID=63592 RepID=A0A7S1SKF2_9CHLO
MPSATDGRSGQDPAPDPVKFRKSGCLNRDWMERSSAGHAARRVSGRAGGGAPSALQNDSGTARTGQLAPSPRVVVPSIDRGLSPASTPGPTPRQNSELSLSKVPHSLQVPDTPLLADLDPFDIEGESYDDYSTTSGQLSGGDIRQLSQHTGSFYGSTGWSAPPTPGGAAFLRAGGDAPSSHGPYTDRMDIEVALRKLGVTPRRSTASCSYTPVSQPTAAAQRRARASSSGQLTPSNGSTMSSRQVSRAASSELPPAWVPLEQQPREPLVSGEIQSRVSSKADTIDVYKISEASAAAILRVVQSPNALFPSTSLPTTPVGGPKKAERPWPATDLPNCGPRWRKESRSRWQDAVESAGISPVHIDFSPQRRS